MLLLLVSLLVLITTALSIKTNKVGKDVSDFCPHTAKHCVFDWDVRRQQSMMYYNGVLAHPVVWRNGSFVYRTDCATDSDAIPINETVLANVHTVVGEYQYLTTINGLFPGPSVVAYEGQEIEIEVTNKLFQESMGIHWHGMKQLNTNWMDGVPGTTQCPINPEESFTYRFIASPAGTHWYHSHQGTQRAQGLYGAFIVLPHPNKTPRQSSPPITLPSFEAEFMMMVSDNDPDPPNLALTSFLNDLKQYMFAGWNDTGYCFGGSKKAPNGVSAATFRFHSALFNGKGYEFDANGQPKVDVPLETYTVKPNMAYRFRAINSAAHYAFKISVDEHMLTLIASDGQDIQPVVADAFYINPGERFDFYIYTNQTIQNYWFRAETIEWEPHHSLAILNYDGAPMTKPTTNDTSVGCVGRKCIIVNCPFPSFIRGPHVNATCLNFESIKSAYPYKKPNLNLVEHFVSFEKTVSPFNRKYDTANGVMFIRPSSPPTVLGTAKYDHDCRTMPQCKDVACQCTNQIDLPLGHVVQIILLANTTHPIHLHGHYFEVVKIGYPPAGFHPINFKSLKPNQDVICNNHLCNNAFWRDSSWKGGNVPGINTVNPPRKDTITIPAYGYVVLRFTTDNPGWWLMHCHIESHFAQGMGVLFQAGTDGEMTLTPAGFKTCGTYELSQKDFLYAMTTTVNEANMTTDKGWTDREKKLAYGYIGVGIGGIILGLIFCCIFMSCRSNKSKGFDVDKTRSSNKRKGQKHWYYPLVKI